MQHAACILHFQFPMRPILFEFGIITVFSLWFFVAAGFVTGSFVLIHLAKRNRIKLTLLTNHSFLLFFWILFISRLTFILLNPDFYFFRFNLHSAFALFAIWDKGLSFWGAVAALYSGIWYLAKRDSQSPLRLFDILVTVLLIGMFFGHLGAFFDGIHYGKPTTLPWGITFRSAHVKYISKIHPTQLYSAFTTLCTAVFLFFLTKRLRGLIPGFIAEVGVFFISLFTFLEEFVRGDETIELLGVRLPQIVALLGILVSGYFIYQRYTIHALQNQIP